jgi:hypothetical protein
MQVHQSAVGQYTLSIHYSACTLCAHRCTTDNTTEPHLQSVDGTTGICCTCTAAWIQHSRKLVKALPIERRGTQPNRSPAECCRSGRPAEPCTMRIGRCCMHGANQRDSCMYRFRTLQRTSRPSCCHSQAVCPGVLALARCFTRCFAAALRPLRCQPLPRFQLL